MWIRWMVGCALLLAACGGKTMIVNGIEVYESHWNRTQDELRPRASFDLGCDANALKFTLFRRDGREPSEVGVDGCGQRATYVRPHYSAMGPGGLYHERATTWQLNSTTHGVDAANAKAEQAAPPPPAAPPANP